MASNYTTNYELPLWEPQDSFLRTEFNEAHQKIDDALGNMAQIASGQYTGTGEYGASAPCQLEFSFQPLFLFITANLSVGNYATVLIPDTMGLGWSTRSSQNMVSESSSVDVGGFRCYTEFSGNTVSWYNLLSAGAQLNAANQVYRYSATGI